MGIHPRYKNQTSEKRYKVPTKALPPMRDLGSLYFLNRHTFVCGSLFPGIKLNELYSRKQTSTYKSAILADIQRTEVAEFALAQWYSRSTVALTDSASSNMFSKKRENFKGLFSRDRNLLRIANPFSDLAGGVPKYVFFECEHFDIFI